MSGPRSNSKKIQFDEGITKSSGSFGKDVSRFTMSNKPDVSMTKLMGMRFRLDSVTRRK